MNLFKYTLDNKRYHTFNYYLKNKYNCKVAKVIIDGHFTCPNRDGTKGQGGCTYCSLSGSGDSNLVTSKSIIEQYNTNKKIMDKKWKNDLYIPYFQSFSNTYGPLYKIQEMLSPFVDNKEVCEISLATRCDCLKDEVIEYLNSLTNSKTIWLELGLQTSNDKTGEIINRGYTFKEFKEALSKLEKTNIKVCVHIINGLPYEKEEDFIKTIKDINHLNFHAIKIHMLYIIKNTKIAEEYNLKKINLLTRDEYIDIVVKQLRLLKPEIIIERLTGDPLKDDLIAPNWITNKTTILNDIDKLMLKEDIYQGDQYK